MEKPELMPQDIGRLMVDCWKLEPNQRPTFSQLTESLVVYMETSALSTNYLQMDNKIGSSLFNKELKAAVVDEDNRISDDDLPPPAPSYALFPIVTNNETMRTTSHQPISDEIEMALV